MRETSTRGRRPRTREELDQIVAAETLAHRIAGTCTDWILDWRGCVLFCDLVDHYGREHRHLPEVGPMVHWVHEPDHALGLVDDQTARGAMRIELGLCAAFLAARRGDDDDPNVRYCNRTINHSGPHTSEGGRPDHHRTFEWEDDGEPLDA